MMKYCLPLLFFLGFISSLFAGESLLAIDPESIPSHVQSIEADNTLNQKTRDVFEIEAEKHVQKWLKKSNVDLNNPYLIEQLNETEVKSSFFAFGYSSEVYLGRWPLSYQSSESSVNWAYQKVNQNYVPEVKMTYFQNEEKHVIGGIQSKLDYSNQVQDMILSDVRNRMDWPIDYQASFGVNTQKKLTLSNESGAENLEAYAGAVKETGLVTYGDVYLKMTGRKQKLVIKNVIDEEVIAWLPIQNYLAFHLKN